MKDYEAAYKALKETVESALDVRDDAGNKLRDWKFNNSGFVQRLQGVLVNGLDRAEEVLND